MQPLSYADRILAASPSRLSKFACANTASRYGGRRLAAAKQRDRAASNESWYSSNSACSRTNGHLRRKKWPDAREKASLASVIIPRRSRHLMYRRHMDASMHSGTNTLSYVSSILGTSSGTLPSSQSR